MNLLRAEKAPPPQTYHATTREGFEGFEGGEDTGFRGQKVPTPQTLKTFKTSFDHVLRVLESGCPELVAPERWQQAVVDAQRFLARWDEQAHALGWTAKDLFGLQTPPEKPHPSYRRLSRYDETGLIWLLCGREVVALTEATAAIQNPTGAITIYRRHNKPALGPIGDSLDDLEPSGEPDDDGNDTRSEKARGGSS
jgi:hypothetical protein